jgi:hypothetical protein
MTVCIRTVVVEPASDVWIPVPALPSVALTKGTVSVLVTVSVPEGMGVVLAAAACDTGVRVVCVRMGRREVFPWPPTPTAGTLPFSVPEPVEVGIVSVVLVEGEVEDEEDEGAWSVTVAAAALIADVLVELGVGRC